MKALLAGIALLVVLGVGFLLYSSPTAPPEMTETDRQVVADEVKQASKDWIATWAQNDIDGALAYFLEDLGSYFVGEPGLFLNNYTLLPTLTEVSAVFEGAREARSGSGIFPLEESVAVLSPDHAVQVWVAEFNVTDTEGVTTPNYPVTMTLVWVRHEGAWKIMHFHQTWTTDIADG
jgi:uncharacterized protein (TIGR02246 family)